MPIIDSINTLLTQQKTLLDRFTSKSWVEKLETTISDIKVKFESAITPNDVLNKTLYVSISGGNDMNDGSVDHPLKTIKTAIDLIPVSGYGKIILLNNNDPSHTAQTFSIDSDIIIKNKTIIIENEIGMKFNNRIKFGYSSEDLISYKFKLESNVHLSFTSVDIQSAVISDHDKSRMGIKTTDADIKSIIELNNAFGVINFFKSNLTINDYNFINSNGFSDIGISVVNSNVNCSSNAKYLLYADCGMFKVSSINNILKQAAVEVNITNLVKDKDPNTSLITFIPSSV